MRIFEGVGREEKGLGNFLHQLLKNLHGGNQGQGLLV